jgi:DNA-binding PadR family transcriptional regulator
VTAAFDNGTIYATFRKMVDSSLALVRWEDYKQRKKLQKEEE